MAEETRPQGTAPEDLDHTRVPRSVSFLVVMVAYGLNLTFQPSIHLIAGQRFYGCVVVVLTVAITIASLAKVDITHRLRRIAFTLLSGVLVALAVWNGINGAYQSATLLAYPISICWIEVWLGFIVAARRARRRRESASVLSEHSLT